MQNHLLARGDSSILKHERKEQEEVDDAEEEVHPTGCGVHVDVEVIEEDESVAAEWRESALKRWTENET